MRIVFGWHMRNVWVLSSALYPVIISNNKKNKNYKLFAAVFAAFASSGVGSGSGSGAAFAAASAFVPHSSITTSVRRFHSAVVVEHKVIVSLSSSTAASTTTSTSSLTLRKMSSSQEEEQVSNGSTTNNESTSQTMTSSSSSSPSNHDHGQNPLSKFGLPEPLLLGSASFTRKLILKEMGIPFVKMVRPIDEKSLGDRSKDKPSDLVLTLAIAKMNHLLSEIENHPEDLPTRTNDNGNDNDSNNKEWIVLTGDQVVTCNGTILEKPESIEEAKQFCQMYATFPPATVGSCVITHLPSKIQVSGVDTATIYFQPSIGNDASHLIDTLVSSGEAILSCAGGLMIEHPLTKQYLDRIDGTEDSVMGLSKDLVLRLLQELSEKVKNQ